MLENRSHINLDGGACEINYNHHQRSINYKDSRNKEMIVLVKEKNQYYLYNNREPNCLYHHQSTKGRHSKNSATHDNFYSD